MVDSQATAFIREAMPLCETLGIEAEEVSAERVVLTLAWSANLCTAGGVLHGGALMALADSAGATLAYLNLAEDAKTTTIESKTNFVGAVTGGEVTATSAAMHKGSRTFVVETNLTTAGRLVGKVTQTQLVIM